MIPNLSLEEAAVVWGVSRRSAYAYAERGLVRVAVFGRRRTVPAEEVERIRLEGVGPVVMQITPAAPPAPRRGRPRGRAD